MARFNVGSTLQASAPSREVERRRRSTAGSSGLWPGMGGLRMRMPSTQAQQQQAIGEDDESINYENLDELFREEDQTPTPVVRRANSGELATARLNILSAQKADPSGSLQPLPTRRQMFGMYLDSSPAGRRWDQVDALLNTGIAALHVYNTTRLRKDRLGVPYWALLSEAALGALLLAQFVPRYLLAPDPLEFLRSLFSVITLITALTPIAVLANIMVDPGMYSTFMSAGTWVFLYPVVFWRLQPALLRCLVPIKNIYRMSAMTRNVLRALTTVFTTVLAITVLTHVMVFYQNKERSGEIQGFDEALFFIAVSAITGLSSDIEPDTWFTRGVVLFVMFIGIFWLPPRVAEMLSLWSDRSPWPAEFDAEANQAHVLVIGDLEYTALFEFLREFFCEDHGVRTVNTVVVVMSENNPGKEVAELLHDPSYVNRVKFVLGSPTSFTQLERVQAAHAQAIFLLSSKAAGDHASAEDAAKVMVALAVRKFLRSAGVRRRVPIYAQVLLPESTMHMDFLADHVICVEELRLGLLAKSVMVPGFASLLQLLTSSIPATITEPLVRAAGRGRRPWLAEYAQSMSHEIYPTRISSIFVGERFQKAAHVIFQRTGATLFALRIPDRDTTAQGDGRVIINPTNYKLVGDELGFVITDNALASVQIAYLSEAATVSVDDAAAETDPLVAAAEPQRAGSPLQDTLAASEARLHPAVPFGSNVMDTLVVSDAGSDTGALSHTSKRDGNDDDDQRSTGSCEEDLIDMDPTDGNAEAAAGPSVLSPELARIPIAEVSSDHGGNTSDSSGHLDANAADSKRMHRTPLVFDPTLQASSESDLGAKKAVAEEEKKKEVEEKKATSGIWGRGQPQKKEAVAPTTDGLPGDLAGHIVVCDTSGEFPSNIVYLISCIRSAAPSEITGIAEESATSKPPAAMVSGNPLASLYEQISRTYKSSSVGNSSNEVASHAFLNLQPIVILSPGEPSAELHADLERFGNVYVVGGSSLQRLDLARVRIHTAASAIVLANREQWLDAAADTSTRLSLTSADTTATATADAPALLSVLNIETLTYANPDFFMSVEFIHRENMQFVGDTETLKIDEVFGQAFLRPSFMSGRVYAPVMLDTLVCQAYYNEHLLEILQRLIFSHGNVTHALGIAKLREAGIDIPKPEGDQLESLGAGNVFLVEVPPRFYGHSYAGLFSNCCFSHGAIAFGLYRAVFHHGQPMWYVMPNPSPDCLLRENDRVYLLANVRPTLQ
ncbi:hypothetical protein COEREDRAFT_81974 [Coemansia reversa NRRL 1564]|uniref:Uncharacterized protein n=1 Tax=Coemansia reversa (strain ATCC 12441 / NRRL 1564) TaxID=763665 RepID=A0A2G5B8U0_COERN|nr:hypothetical protein COEREDRAFT_81974 [Coemansia reversa NRRL 1564]|eukprot:PIA15421.1 hypothetical protein COEREDRAFT_81974 [Coemansia reversa NRRL 1564]